MCLAIPGLIVSTAGDDPLTRTARVSFGGVEKTVSLACLPEARAGEWVLVHVGFALQRIDAAEAENIIELLEEPDMNREEAEKMQE